MHFDKRGGWGGLRVGLTEEPRTELKLKTELKTNLRTRYSMTSGKDGEFSIVAAM